ncbi:hypothetical protein L218DRAFT_943765 [Marasmius fiardii PR-910]|nr:hypothetical protein L218DRAFT_943765 [Marasmius fiardii PR-910]
MHFLESAKFQTGQCWTIRIRVRIPLRLFATTSVLGGIAFLGPGLLYTVPRVEPHGGILEVSRTPTRPGHIFESASKETGLKTNSRQILPSLEAATFGPFPLSLSVAQYHRNSPVEIRRIQQDGSQAMSLDNRHPSNQPPSQKIALPGPRGDFIAVRSVTKRHVRLLEYTLRVK